ncbi:hypothetical protein FG386_003140 [Cryptosporidium ryanae]|uniref:uncharacterized protein n=1 Tax=Cryptosporidium ryanae TaxID=515981 RepID=UPI00351A6C5A|nr:hypothetical protein FG386_003140 [Cryptosporidium ryanae]
MIDTIKKIKKVGNKLDNGKWVQSSLKNFVNDSGEATSKVENNDGYYNSEDERINRMKEIQNNIKMEKIEEDNLNELFEGYKLRISKVRQKIKECSTKDKDINLYRDEIVEALKWCLSEIKIPGYRVGQEEVIHKLVCDRRDVVLILPTGGGKSLTYQLPSLLRFYQKKVREIPPLSKGMVTVVVSPLIALIEDQINSLKKWGIKSNGLSTAIVQKSEESQSVNKALEELYTDLSRKTPQNSIVYITPESFGTERVLNCLYNLYINNNLFCFAIDEAHCISEWGHDFRVAYRRLGNIKNVFSDIPILACTATASPKVQNDILDVLKLANPYISINSFNRPNIHYTVYNTDKNDYLNNLSQEEIILNSILYMNEYFSRLNKKDSDYGHDNFSESKKPNTESGKIMGIVYVNKRKSSETLSKYLNDNGINSKCYHAGLSLKLRTEIQNEWLDDKIQVLVGTIAFGMGVHKSNVRFVIHSSIPDSIDSYYQQSGRAGRDSKYSRAMLFYSKKDIQTLNCIKRKSLQYLYLKSKEKANQSYEKYQNNINSVVEFAQCNIKLDDDFDVHPGGEGDERFQNAVDYQLNLNKYGECRRRHLLGYFGEKYNNKGKSDYHCCDVCDSKYNKERLNHSFLNYISVNNVTGHKFKNNFCYPKKFSNSLDYKYEYDNYNDNENDDYCFNQNKNYSSKFTTAKSVMMNKNDLNNKFASALTANNKLKVMGVNYSDRLKILEEEESKMEMSENKHHDVGSGSSSILRSIRNSMAKKRPLI